MGAGSVSMPTSGQSRTSAARNSRYETVKRVVEGLPRCSTEEEQHRRPHTPGSPSREIRLHSRCTNITCVFQPGVPERAGLPPQKDFQSGIRRPKSIA